MHVLACTYYINLGKDNDFSLLGIEFLETVVRIENGDSPYGSLYGRVGKCPGYGFGEQVRLGWCRCFHCIRIFVGFSFSGYQPFGIYMGKLQKKFMDKVKAGFVPAREDMRDTGPLDTEKVCQACRRELLQV